MCADPKSAKKTGGLTVFSALLLDLHVKTGHKMLMKLTAGLNFANILCKGRETLKGQTISIHKGLKIFPNNVYKLNKKLIIVQSS